MTASTFVFRPVFVMDGPPPDEKRATWVKRKRKLSAKMSTIFRTGEVPMEEKKSVLVKKHAMIGYII